MYARLHRGFSKLSHYSKALYTSFYSPTIYADVVKRGRGLRMGYLLFLVVLGTLPLSGRVIVAFNHFFEERMLLPFQALPLLTIQHGEVIYHQSMPCLIKNHEGEVISIIDTTGTVSEINQTYPQLTVLITKNKMDFRAPSYKQFLGLSKNSTGNPIYTRTFNKDLNGQFSGTEWIHSTGISKLNVLIQMMIFPCIMLFYLGIFSATLLLLATLTQLYADIFFRLKLPFKAACRLLITASTSTLVLFFIMRCNDWTASGMRLVYSVLLLSYISYGLYSVKQLEA